MKSTKECVGYDLSEANPALCDSVLIGDSAITGLVNIALNEELPETLFIIVGDHMSPFLNKKLEGH